jgi:hypothetical protein
VASGSLLSIWNRALGSIGARSTVQNQNEDSQEAIQCNVFYQSTFEALARSARWGCLRKQTTLTLVSAAPGTPENPQGATAPYPPNPWLYSYLVPADSLFIRQLVPPPAMLATSGGVPIFPVNNSIPYAYNRMPIIRYETALGQDTLGNPAEIILTNLSQAQVIYTANQQNPTFWDSLFQQAMVASLAVFLVPALSLDKALMGIQIQIAERMIAQARAMDGNESITTQNNEASWICARSGETGPYALGQNGPFLNYENVAWPNW